MLNFIEGFRGNGRDNAVHHGRWEGDVLFNPGRQLRVQRPGVGADDIAHHVTVFRHVVAGHHGKSRQACRPTASQSLHHHARRRFWLVRVVQIGDDQRVIELQLAAGRRMTITFLGNGQGDNGYLRLTHRRQHRFEAINLGVQRLLHHPNHACGPGVGGHFGHSVQPILLAEVGDLLLAADEIDFSIAPVAAMFTGKNIGIYRLMGAVECAKTKVHDTGDQRAAIVAWQHGVGG